MFLANAPIMTKPQSKLVCSSIIGFGSIMRSGYHSCLINATNFQIYYVLILIENFICRYVNICKPQSQNQMTNEQKNMRKKYWFTKDVEHLCKLKIITQYMQTLKKKNCSVDGGRQWICSKERRRRRSCSKGEATSTEL